MVGVCEYVSHCQPIVGMLFRPHHVQLTQQRRVPATTIDDLGLQRCDVLKIDVEGMEAAVADGARRTIAAFKPMVFYEDNGDAGSRADLTSPSFMEEFGYSCYSRAEPLVRRNNWAGVSRDAFSVNGNSGESRMLFCVTKEHMGPDSFFVD